MAARSGQWGGLSNLFSWTFSSLGGLHEHTGTRAGPDVTLSESGATSDDGAENNSSWSFFTSVFSPNAAVVPDPGMDFYDSFYRRGMPPLRSSPTNTPRTNTSEATPLATFPDTRDPLSCFAAYALPQPPSGPDRQRPLPFEPEHAHMRSSTASVDKETTTALRLFANHRKFNLDHFEAQRTSSSMMKDLSVHFASDVKVHVDSPENYLPDRLGDGASAIISPPGSVLEFGTPQSSERFDPPRSILRSATILAEAQQPLLLPGPRHSNDLRFIPQARDSQRASVGCGLGDTSYSSQYAQSERPLLGASKNVQEDIDNFAIDVLTIGRLKSQVVRSKEFAMLTIAQMEEVHKAKCKTEARIVLLEDLIRSPSNALSDECLL